MQLTEEKKAEETMEEKILNHITNQGTPVRVITRYYYTPPKLATLKNL